jgi:hypothetical protein
MKIRNGFVSNSSSSSFTCGVCGEEASGWDICMSEAEMHECTNGHTFCDSHMTATYEGENLRKFVLEDCCLEEEDKVKVLAMDDEELEEYVEEEDLLCDSRYDCPEYMCPICSFGEVESHEAYLYLLKKVGLTQTELLEQLKDQFKNYSEFKEFIKTKKATDEN